MIELEPNEPDKRAVASGQNPAFANYDPLFYPLGPDLQEYVRGRAEMMARGEDSDDRSVQGRSQSAVAEREVAAQTVALLAQEVERISNGQYTVRGASYDLSMFEPQPPLMFAVCHKDGAPEQVTECDQVVGLYGAGRGDGIHKIAMIDPEHLARWRESRRQGEIERAYQAEIAATAEASIAQVNEKMHGAVTNAARSVSEPKAQRNLQVLTNGGPGTFSVEKAAKACAILGVDFAQFAAAAISGRSANGPSGSALAC